MCCVMEKWIQVWQANINIEIKLLSRLIDSSSAICTTRFLISPKFVSFCILRKLSSTMVQSTISRLHAATKHRSQITCHLTCIILTGFTKAIPKTQITNHLSSYMHNSHRIYKSHPNLHKNRNPI